MYPVEYEARIWNEFKGEHGEEEVVHGITFAETFTEAASNLESYYGSDLLVLKTYMMEEESVPIYEFESTNENYHGMIKLPTVEIYDGY